MTSSKDDRPEAEPRTQQPPQDGAIETDEAPAEATPTDLEAAAAVEAILFTADAPLPAAKITQVAALSGQRVVKQAVALLNQRYDREGCAFHIEAIAGGYQMLTRVEFHDVVSRLQKDRGESRLSQAALETLAIVAYRQPVLRADIEAIRGVACGDLLRSLLERQLIRITGRAEVLGRPMLYGTAKRFLEVFGLASLDELPQVQELRSGAAAKEPSSVPAPQASPAAPPAQDDASAASVPHPIEAPAGSS